MHPFDVERTLKTFKILVDTREQPTERYYQRIESMGVPVERCKLDFGDYSASVVLPDGNIFYFCDSICVERKMNIDELCNCFCRDRKRFFDEFERAKRKRAKVFLLVECATWEKIYRKNYSSMMHPNALIASLISWMSNFDFFILFSIM